MGQVNYFGFGSKCKCHRVTIISFECDSDKSSIAFCGDVRMLFLKILPYRKCD